MCILIFGQLLLELWLEGIFLQKMDCCWTLDPRSGMEKNQIWNKIPDNKEAQTSITKITRYPRWARKFTISANLKSANVLGFPFRKSQIRKFADPDSQWFASNILFHLRENILFYEIPWNSNSHSNFNFWDRVR
jgi:hypothetical protein